MAVPVADWGANRRWEWEPEMEDGSGSRKRSEDEEKEKGVVLRKRRRKCERTGEGDGGWDLWGASRDLWDTEVSIFSWLNRKKCLVVCVENIQKYLSSKLLLSRWSIFLKISLDFSKSSKIFIIHEGTKTIETYEREKRVKNTRFIHKNGRKVKDVSFKICEEQFFRKNFF